MFNSKSLALFFTVSGYYILMRMPFFLFLWSLEYTNYTDLTFMPKDEVRSFFKGDIEWVMVFLRVMI